MLALSFATPLAFARRECVRHASKAAKAHAKAKARAETRKQAEKTASRKERRNAKSTPPPAKAQEQRNAIQMKSQSKRPPSFKSQTVAVNERVIFESKSDEMPVRLQAAFGLVVAMGTGALAYNLIWPMPVYSADGQKVVQEVNWKTYAFAGGAIVAGVFCAGYSLFHPMRSVAKLVLLPPLGQLLPAKTPSAGFYDGCQVRIHSMASQAFPGLFKPKTVPFPSIELLGPLSKTVKRYHPQSTAFDASRFKGGRAPSHVPFRIGNARTTYVLRRDLGRFEHLEQIEEALLANKGRAT